MSVLLQRYTHFEQRTVKNLHYSQDKEKQCYYAEKKSIQVRQHAMEKLK